MEVHTDSPQNQGRECAPHHTHLLHIQVTERQFVPPVFGLLHTCFCIYVFLYIRKHTIYYMDTCMASRLLRCQLKTRKGNINNESTHSPDHPPPNLCNKRSGNPKEQKVQNNVWTAHATRAQLTPPAPNDNLRCCSPLSRLLPRPPRPHLPPLFHPAPAFLISTHPHLPSLFSSSRLPPSPPHLPPRPPLLGILTYKEKKSPTQRFHQESRSSENTKS